MNVFYGSFYYSHLWKIAKELEKKYNWRPTYWFGTESQRIEIEQHFPGVVFQDYLLARRAIHSNDLKNLPFNPLDKDILDKMLKYAIFSEKIFARNDTTGHNFSIQDLTHHFYLMLEFWLKVIKTQKIELVVFWTNPHGCEYVLYILCKELGIPFIYLDCAYYITSDTHFISNSIDDRTWILKKYLKENIGKQLLPSEEFYHRINQQKSDYSVGQPDYMTEKDLWIKKGFHFSDAKAELVQILSMIKNNPFSKINDHFKFNPGRYESPQATSGTRLQHYLYQKKLNRNKREYFKIYSALIEAPRFDIDYVYFAAPFQPEGTTLPDAGVFEDLILVLKLLSFHLPKGWIIYYKEHPSTFDSTLSTDNYRGQDYYDRIKEIPNLKFVHHKTDTFKLIDNSKAIATVTGTVGWESVVRGRPTITFGDAWYNYCDGVFAIKSNNDLKLAFEKIATGFRPSFTNVLTFAAILEKFIIKDLKFRNFSRRQHEIKNLDQELFRYAEYFYESYKTFYL